MRCIPCRTAHTQGATAGGIEYERKLSGKDPASGGSGAFHGADRHLQLLGSFIRFGPVSVSLVALPIVIGAAVYGSAAGLWLGFVFGMVVLLSGDAAAFFAFSVPGTLLTVLVKGIACGGLAGLVYAWLAQKKTARLPPSPRPSSARS